MKDQSNKLHELKENSNAVFQELFGKKEAPQQGAGQIVKIGPGNYRMGKSVITGLQGASDTEILNYDFESSKLSWLLDCHFEGILNLDLKRGELEAFAGTWKSGIFQGKIFGNKSVFEGGQFGVPGQIAPKYVPTYDTWKTSPMNFGNGTIDRETGGILGIPNAPDGEIKGDINIISIQPGKSITIKLRNNVVHTINFLKRIDSRNSDFTIETIDGATKKSTNKTFEWADSKNALMKPFNPYKTASFLGLDLSAKVVSATISSSGKDTLTHKAQGGARVEPKALSKELQVMKLAELPFLGISKITRPTNKAGEAVSLYFNFPTPEHKAGHGKVVQSIKQGWVKSYITQLRTAITNKALKGAPSTHKYLANIIGEDPELDVNELGDENLVNSINGIENFLKYFVNTTVSNVRKSGAQKGITGVDDKIGRETINNKLKELLGVAEAAPEEKTPVATKAAPKSSLNKGANVVKESVRSAVREIISKNMKHF